MNPSEPALAEERTTTDVADTATATRPTIPPGSVEGEAESRLTVIRPASRLPRLDIGELWHYRELLWTLVWRDVSVRYKQTFLGIAWAILVPAFTALIYVIIFGKFANFPAGDTPYPTLVIAGVLPMQYFASALTQSSMSLLANLPLVTKVYFPRTLLPLTGVSVPLVDLVVGLPVLILLMWKYGTWPDGWKVLTAPLFMLLAVVTVPPWITVGKLPPLARFQDPVALSSASPPVSVPLRLTVLFVRTIEPSWDWANVPWRSSVPF